jgi:hypothetical protein
MKYLIWTIRLLGCAFLFHLGWQVAIGASLYFIAHELEMHMEQL